MIEFKNIAKRYAGQTRNAVEGFTLTINSGDICVLLGPSGCGKTTTLRTVNRMVEVDSGEILIDGQNIRATAKEELRKRIGYVIQSIGLFPHFSVERNISIVLKLLGWERERQAARVTELLNLIGLSPQKYRHKYPHELSGGEAQRIGVARALAAGQNILLMDEPFGAVDPLRRDVLQQEFLAIQRKLKKTVLFVTHDLDEAIRIADIIVIMDGGRMIQADTPEQILASPRNNFVKEFIGEDRALKRLGRFSIKEYLRSPHTVLKSPSNSAIDSATDPAIDPAIDPTAKRKLDHHSTYWEVDQERRITGIIKHDNGKQVYIPFAPRSFTLREHHTLRDALSRALGLGVDAVPIVDEEYRVVGEVLVSEIEQVNQHGLKY